MELNGYKKVPREALPKESFHYSCFLFLPVQEFVPKTMHRPQNSATSWPRVASGRPRVASTLSLKAGSLRQVSVFGSWGIQIHDSCIRHVLKYLLCSEPPQHGGAQKKTRALASPISSVGAPSVLMGGLITRSGRPIAFKNRW